ncbi:hypothetical protein O181_075220 [Austropuccinia psidii MF-1]|uniref:Uncharacterized protein n=1 Tax=Austropuccinia psidii MF-1 TaxID=1389203 RepID=A0A9Q3FDZ1_9BASI|nr:hypothetical protein [Austropuccinia psidii MF-1]
MGNWSILVFYGVWDTPPVTVHILRDWPFRPILHLTNPHSNSLVLGLGGPSGLPGASEPSSNSQGPWAHHFDYGVFGPFSPPTASTIHKPRTADCVPWDP